MRSVGPLITLFALLVPCALPAQERPSLRGKSNAELLVLMLGQERIDDYAREEAKLRPKWPDGFWTMPPREAARALVMLNCDEKSRPSLQLTLSEPSSRQVPAGGEVGLRWQTSGCYIVPRSGLALLRYANGVGSISWSSVEVSGEVPEDQIQIAIERTRTTPLAPARARHLYETLWWLGQAQFDRTESGTIVSTGDGHATFWCTPGLETTEVSLFGPSFGDRYGEGFTEDLYASFTQAVLKYALEREGVDLETATAVLGQGKTLDRETASATDQSKPATRDPKEIERWLTNRLDILHDPKSVYLRSGVISDLVPWEEPMRYGDARLDSALLDLVHRIAGAPDRNGIDSSELWAAAKAAQSLAWRDQTDVFPFLVMILRSDPDVHSAETFLDAATLLASKHDEFRAECSKLLQEWLARGATARRLPLDFLDAAWRGEFFELRPEIEKLATNSSDEIEDTRAGSYGPMDGEKTGRFHQARRILTAWSEPDPLTRLKLNAVVEASSRHLFGPALFLRRDFDALASDKQAVFLDYVRWLGTRKIWFNWYTASVEVEFGVRAREPESCQRPRNTQPSPS